jgi:V/A-type H+/Na+-transporting ATPase subunit E
MSAGTEKIVSSIMSDAQIKAESILGKAEEENKSILEKGHNEALQEKEKILDDARKQSNMKYQQLISEAKMNSRRMELEAREEIIEESFKKAEDKLKEIASSNAAEYKESLKQIITEAATEIGGGELFVLLKVSDDVKIADQIDAIAQEVSTKTGKETTLTFGENIKTIGGAIVKTKNGEIEVNNTIEARMSRYKKDLRSKVAAVLFK